MIGGSTRAARRRLVLDAGGNGIDLVEAGRDRALLVRFLAPLPEGAYDLPEQPERVSIEGGVHVTGIRPVRVTRAGPAALRVLLDRRGDLSTYTLSIDAAALDPGLRLADFSFRDAEPAVVDCQPAAPPPAEPLAPLPDYLAKDYASFRQVLLDLVSRLNPGWTERSAADLGIALVELLAYTGDHLSYLQDAIAGEGFLDRARLRVSARRHVRLLDVRMRDGRNAWTWVCFSVQAAGTVPRGTRMLTEAPSIAGPLTPDTLERDPALAGAVVFETTHGQPVTPLHNSLRVHDWGVPGNRLPAGATRAHLYGLDDSGRPVRPSLRAGDWLLIEEVLGETGGLDPTHRQVVRLTAVRPDHDPLLSVPLQLVEWDLRDALLTPYLVSAPSDRDEGWPPAALYTVARGNIAAADHGLSTDGRLVGPAPALPSGPLTVQCPPAGLDGDRRDLGCAADAALPAIELSAAGEPWTPVPDLLGSGPFDRVFVVEIDDAGIGRLRFGDGVHGARPPDALDARWRVGGGSAGNVGAESLQHLVVDGPEQPWMLGASVRNPLDARGGQDPETIADVRGRLSLPGTTPRRAVTEADYVAAVRDVPGVAAAAASLRWTGSWYTAFVAVQPADPRGLLEDGRGWRLAPGLAALVGQRLEHVRLAGRDVEVRAPHPAGLDVALRVAMLPGYLAPDVLDAVTARLLAQPRVLGGPVYLSQLVAAAQAVEGVASVAAERFRRFGQPDPGELLAGVIRLGPFDLASLGNDPDRPQLGVLRVAPEEEVA